MALYCLILTYFILAAHAAMFPAPTAVAQLEKRQTPNLSYVWSLTVSGTTTGYEAFSLPGATVTSTGNYWGACPIGAYNCNLATACQSGTIIYASLSSTTCSSVSPVCGTEYLYSTIGAQQVLTRPACFSSTGTYVRTFFLVSPTSGTTSSSSPSSTTSSISSTSTAPTPSPTPTGSSTHVGAIAGGVVGGVALIAIVALVIVLALRRRRRQSPAAASTAVQSDVAQPQKPSYDSPYGPKHHSYSSSYPTSATGSPPSMYQNFAGYNQGYYPQTGTPSNHMPMDGAYSHSPPHNLSTSPMGTSQSPMGSQPHYGSSHPSSIGSPIEMPGSTQHASRPVEMH